MKPSYVPKRKPPKKSWFPCHHSTMTKTTTTTTAATTTTEKRRKKKLHSTEERCWRREAKKKPGIKHEKAIEEKIKLPHHVRIHAYKFFQRSLFQLYLGCFSILTTGCLLECFHCWFHNIMCSLRGDEGKILIKTRSSLYIHLKF